MVLREPPVAGDVVVVLHDTVAQNKYDPHMPSKDEQRRAAESTTNSRTWFYATLVVLVGVILLWFATANDWLASRTPAKELTAQLGSLLVVTGGLAILWDLKGRRDLVDEVLAKAELRSDVATTGLKRASMDWRMVEWKNLIKSSREIDVFIAYGSTWLSTHSTELEAFAADRRNQLRYFLPDPDDESTMEMLAARFQYTPEILVSKVSEAARSVAQISRGGEADVRIWYRTGVPTFTCYRFDDTVVVTLYSHKLGRGMIPTLVLDRGTFADFFREEFSAVHSQSREVALNELLGATDES